jgi:hypothetical protein
VVAPLWADAVFAVAASFFVGVAFLAVAFLGAASAFFGVAVFDAAFAFFGVAVFDAAFAFFGVAVFDAAFVTALVEGCFAGAFAAALLGVACFGTTAVGAAFLAAAFLGADGTGGIVDRASSPNDASTVSVPGAGITIVSSCEGQRTRSIDPTSAVTTPSRSGPFPDERRIR